MCDIPFNRSILQLSNGIRHVMPSTDIMLELTAKHRWLSRLTAGCVFQWVKIKKHICEIAIICVCFFVSTSETVDRSFEIWHEQCVIMGHSIFGVLNFLQS
jgi:hypothetical protein